MERFYVNYISAHKSQMTFMGLDFEADLLRMKAELRVMMDELCLKSNWTKPKQYHVTYLSLQNGTKLLM